MMSESRESGRKKHHLRAEVELLIHIEEEERQEKNLRRRVNIEARSSNKNEEKTTSSGDNTGK